MKKKVIISILILTLSIGLIACNQNVETLPTDVENTPLLGSFIKSKEFNLSEKHPEQLNIPDIKTKKHSDVLPIIAVFMSVSSVLLYYVNPLDKIPFNLFAFFVIVLSTGGLIAGSTAYLWKKNKISALGEILSFIAVFLPFVFLHLIL